MNTNCPTNQLDPRLVRAFVQKTDATYFRILKKKCFEQVVFFQPTLKNIRKIANIDFDSYLLPYLSKSMHVLLGAAEKNAVWGSIEKTTFRARIATVTKSSANVRACRISNRFDFFLAVQSLAQKIVSISESNAARMQQEAFWRLKIKRDRVDEAKAFLLSMKYTVKKIQMRRFFLFASAKANALKNNKHFQARLTRLESLLKGKMRARTKETMLQLSIHKRTYDYYESIFQEHAPDAKRCSLKIIGEFDSRPNSFAAIVNKRTDLLRVLLLFRTLHFTIVDGPKAKARDEFCSRLKELLKKRPVLSADKASRGFKLIHRVIQSRRNDVWKLLVKLPPSASLTAKILISHVFEKVELKTRTKNYSLKTVNIMSIVLQEITKHRKMAIWQILRKYAARMQAVSQKEKILYAKVEYIKRNPTIGNFMLGETTPLVPASPREYTTAYINDFQPQASSRMGTIISLFSPKLKNRC